MCLDVVVLTFHVGIGRCVSWVEINVKQVLGGWPGRMHKQLISCLNLLMLNSSGRTGRVFFNQMNKMLNLRVQAHF